MQPLAHAREGCWTCLLRAVTDGDQIAKVDPAKVVLEGLCLPRTDVDTALLHDANDQWIDVVGSRPALKAS